MDFIPSICGDNNIYIPEEGCSDCDKFEARLEKVEQTNDEQDERLDTLEECCEKVKPLVESHETAIESIENRFSDYYPKPETYTQQQVDELLGQIETSSYVEVDELPDEGEPQTIYLVPNGQGSYEQWIWSDGAWVDLGGTNIDMSDYIKVDDVIDMIHPVGDTVIRLDDIDPATLYTGTTWQLVSQGRMIIGANATYPLGSYGGSADAVVISHNHTQNSHSHSAVIDGRSGKNFIASPASSMSSRQFTTGGSGSYAPYQTSSGQFRLAWSSTETPSINYTGESGVGKNMPPYLAVNIWVRTA